MLTSLVMRYTTLRIIVASVRGQSWRVSNTLPCIPRDPVKTADFYKEVFGMEEILRQPKDTGEHAVWLSDGYIFFAILKFGTDDVPNLGNGPSTVEGVHHIGFFVDDLDESVAAFAANGGVRVPGQQPRQPQVQGPPTG